MVSTVPPSEIDVVIPIPESSRPSAAQLAQLLGLPYREGFVKNRYVGRTFIMPGQAVRKKSVRQKLNVIASEFKGRNVLLVDDSIVRGTTSREIVQMARDAGARKVYLASAAPPVRYPNVYGIDMPTADELVAHNRTVEEVRQIIGADALIYQDVDGMKKAIGALNPAIQGFDASCFDGVYVTGDITAADIERLNERRVVANEKTARAWPCPTWPTDLRRRRMKKPVRTRIAPPRPPASCTWARRAPALYSWAYARHHGGEFVLRIEDTDVARSTQESVEQILQSMRWLGLDYDEGPIYQMKRLARYQAVVDQLIAQGKAYHCYSTPRRAGRGARSQEGAWRKGAVRRPLAPRAGQGVAAHSRGREAGGAFSQPGGRRRHLGRPGQRPPSPSATARSMT